MSEQFITKVQAQQRVLIPIDTYEVLKLKQGDRVRVTIEKVK